MIEQRIQELERRLVRIEKLITDLENQHLGNEQNLTYHAGFRLGYLKGKRYEIECWVDELKEKVLRDNANNLQKYNEFATKLYSRDEEESDAMCESLNLTLEEMEELYGDEKS